MQEDPPKFPDKPTEPTEAADEASTLGGFMSVIAWIGVIGLLAFVLSEFLAQEHNPNQSLAANVDSAGVREVVLERNRQGHYVASGRINGEKVVFLLDTGATQVAVPGRLAERLGLKRGVAFSTHTANGVGRAYATRLQSVGLGPITQHNIRASILPGMHGDEVLLGMSFLKRLELVQRGNQLTVRQVFN